MKFAIPLREPYSCSRVDMMHKSDFWKLIETAKEQGNGEPDRQIELLAVALEQRAPQEIMNFDRILAELKGQSYRNDLWAAAYIIRGGCSDAGFEYFRCWLIAQGQRIFEEALRDPETLVDAIDYADDERPETIDMVGAEMIGIAWRAYAAKTGAELAAFSVPLVLQGADWDEDDVGWRYPKLRARFG